MITSSTSGVWELDDVFAKVNAQRWRPNGGALFSLGYNNYGQLGQNNVTYYSSPVQIPGTTWSIIGTNSHSLATKTDGTLWTWGSNAFGNLGQNNTTQYSSPVQIPGTQWKTIFASNHSLAIKSTVQ